MTRLITLALSAVASMLLLLQFLAPQDQPAAAPSASAGNAPEARRVMFATTEENPGEIQIPRDGSGQFHLKARVNGSEERFLIDTGADVVALTVDAAEAAGLPVDPTAFQPIMKTASGEGQGALFRVDDLEVAGRSFRNIEVVVLEGLETNLLGQSVLRKFGKVELRGDRMVISHD